MFYIVSISFVNVQTKQYVRRQNRLENYEQAYNLYRDSKSLFAFFRRRDLQPDNVIIKLLSVRNHYAKIIHCMSV